MHRYQIVKTSSAILVQVGTSCKRPFRVTLSPKCSYRVPTSQQKGPWDSPRKNPGENTGLYFVEYSMCSDLDNQSTVDEKFWKK